jgi:hypothetical protein
MLDAFRRFRYSKRQSVNTLGFSRPDGFLRRFTETAILPIFGVEVRQNLSRDQRRAVLGE